MVLRTARRTKGIIGKYSSTVDAFAKKTHSKRVFLSRGGVSSLYAVHVVVQFDVAVVELCWYCIVFIVCLQRHFHLISQEIQAVVSRDTRNSEQVTSRCCSITGACEQRAKREVAE